jgi:hypothetical protein
MKIPPEAGHFEKLVIFKSEMERRWKAQRPTLPGEMIHLVRRSEKFFAWILPDGTGKTDEGFDKGKFLIFSLVEGEDEFLIGYGRDYIENFDDLKARIYSYGAFEIAAYEAFMYIWHDVKPYGDSDNHQKDDV